MAGKAPDISPRCINFEKFGSCPYGMLCRFGGAHIDDNLKNIVDEEKVKETGGKFVVRNLLSKDLQIQLRKRNVHFKKSDQYMRTLDTRKKESKRPEGPGCTDHSESPPVVLPTSGDAHNHAGTVTDADVIKLRPEEKKKLDVKDKLLLAPLTTVSAAES